MSDIQLEDSPGQVPGPQHPLRTTMIALFINSLPKGKGKVERKRRPTIDFDKASIITKTIYEHVEYPHYHTIHQTQLAELRTYYVVRPILHIIEKYYHQL
jgi:hypothetical protein